MAIGPRPNNASKAPAGLLPFWLQKWGEGRGSSRHRPTRIPNCPQALSFEGIAPT